MELQRFEVEGDGYFNLFGIYSYEKSNDFKISEETIRASLDGGQKAFYISLNKEQEMKIDVGILSHSNYISVFKENIKEIAIHKYKLKKFIDKIIQ